jgi:AbiV family abortive infection protein
MLVSLKIPTAKIQEGMKLALRKCEEHLSNAETLISKNGISDAVALIEHSIEEFGRAVALSQKLKVGSEQVEIQLFRSHDYKYNMAWTVLPSSLKTIYEGTFDVAAFASSDFDVEGETISPMTRLDATYVNYDEKSEQWKSGIRADSSKLSDIIKGIRNCIRNYSW